MTIDIRIMYWALTYTVEVSEKDDSLYSIPNLMWNWKLLAIPWLYGHKTHTFGPNFSKYYVLVNFIFMQYFNYMGMLAVEGTYDKMEALLSMNIHPADILLMMAASEGDKPKIEELLKAGAKYDVKDAGGKTALDKAVNDEIKNFILSFTTQKAWSDLQHPKLKLLLCFCFSEILD